MIYDHHLEVFIAVADAGSLSKAAKNLFITQPALTKQILLLEKSVGFPLFSRTHTGVILTEAGRSFYGDAKRLIRISNEAVERAQVLAGIPKQHIRIGCFSSVRNLTAYILPRVVKKYKPNLEIHLVEYPGKLAISSIEKGLKEKYFDTVEFGYCDNIEKSGLVFRKLYETEVSFEIPPDHPLACKKSLTAADLSGQKFYLAKKGNCAAFDLLRHYLENEVPSAIIVEDEGTDSTTIARCQNEGLILVLFRRPIDSYEPLIHVLPPWKIPLDIGLITQENADQEIMDFIDWAQKIFPTELSSILKF